jgi:DNA-binding MarR family transcriptional regulator
MRYNSAVARQITAADYRALAEFRYQIRRFLHFSETAARRAGLQPQQHQLLLAIRSFQPEGWPSVRELAEQLQLAHHTTVELIDRTAGRGLTRRSRRSDDRRNVTVRLTPRGERILRALSLQHRAELQSGGSRLVTALETVLRRSRRSSRKRSAVRRP